MISDANDLPHGSQLRAEICIVGAGAAGIAVALALRHSGFDVLLLESGGIRQEPEVQALYEGETADEAMHSPPDKYRQRVLGGSTTIWGGRCVPFDPIDFETRDWISHSGWPIRYTDVAQYYPPATQLLEAGASDFDARTAFGIDPPEMFAGFHSARVTTDTLERFSIPSNFGARYRHKLASARSVHVLLHANAIGVDLDGSGTRAKAVRVATLAGKRFTIEARVIVLAAGGLETPRLLLASSQGSQRGIGNDHDVVGRYYQCHIAGNVGELLVTGPVESVRHGYEVAAEGTYCRRRIALVPEEQRRRKIGNMIVRLHFPSIVDPSHRIGVLSALYLAKNFISYEYGKRLHEDHDTSLSTYLAHLRNVVFDAPDTAAFMLHWMRKRTLATRKFPSVILRNRSNRFSMEVHAEQEPRADSRVSLVSETLDPLGMPRLKVDWRYGAKDIETVRSSLDVICEEFRQAGIGTLTYRRENLERDVVRFGAYGGHHIGAVRMGTDRRTSVVDSNCQVHGVDGLYVASAAVFPTSSQANPTLTIVALALRLAEHLCKHSISMPTSRQPTLAVDSAHTVAAADGTVAPLCLQKKILVLGGGGYIGSRLIEALRTAEPTWDIVAAVRGKASHASSELVVDVTVATSMNEALADVDAVVNCVAGNTHSIAEGAKVLFDAASKAAKRPLVVHFSTMAVYGSATGRILENTEMASDAGWYSAAKIQAEKAAQEFASNGGRVVILRPGIVYGPGSETWVGRIARWMEAGRLGDIGPNGDGICNLVYVDDVCAAVISALRTPSAAGQAFNLASPNSQSWNNYFSRLATAIGATPLRRLSTLALRMDSRLLGPPLKAGEILLRSMRIRGRWLPEPIPGSLLTTWQQEIILDSSKATNQLLVRWTADDVGIHKAAEWYVTSLDSRAR